MARPTTPTGTARHRRRPRRMAMAAALISTCAALYAGIPHFAGATSRPATAQADSVAPMPPTVGAAVTGNYRNLFREWNPSLTDADVQGKLDAYWSAFFTSTDDNQRLYYPAGSNANGPMSYIKDTGNGDVRSEGMSYGMMIAVQMNKKTEFDALWNWAKTTMQQTTGARAGYFCWHATEAGSCMDNNPATDGEEYFTTALLFAGNRWGNGGGIYNYTAEANNILNTMLHKQDMNGGVVDSVTNMFDRTTKMPVFVPYASAAQFSDPSYHLPAFYELWSRWADGYQGNQAADRQFWHDAATASRAYFAKATDPATGLNPDYAEFTGAPNNTGGHGDFRFDAWRTAVNWSVDYAWWAAEPNETALTDRLQTFFTNQGLGSYVNQYSLAGNPLSGDRSPGLIASNAAASLSATNQQAWAFVQALWNLQPPTGQYRYYDGLLNFLALLHSSGNFRVYGPDGPTPTPSPSTTTPAAPTNLAAAPSSSGSIALTWTDNSSGQAGFTIERSTDGTTWGSITTTAAGVNTYTDTGPASGTAYSYRVQAVNSAGVSSYSNTATATATPTTNRNPYTQIAAQSYESSAGASLRPDDGGTVVQLSGAGSFLAFDNVDFGSTGAGSVTFRAATTSPGVNLQIRLGSATAAPVCTVYPDGNGSWNTTSNTCHPRPAGQQTVYVTATDAVAVNWLTFTS